LSRATALVRCRRGQASSRRTRIPPGPARGTRLIVADLRALARRLAAAGYPVSEDVRLNGSDLVFVDDPFGNRIELKPLAPAAGASS